MTENLLKLPKHWVQHIINKGKLGNAKSMIP